MTDTERLAALERIAEGGWVAFRRSLGDWLLEASRFHGRGATMRDAIDQVTLRPQLARNDEP